VANRLSAQTADVEVEVPVLEVPVLIVGAGPAGLALSLSLRRYGVDHVLVEKYANLAHTPRAHIINQRTIEIFRHLGISERFYAVAAPQWMMANTLWVTTLAGREVARTESWGAGASQLGEYSASSPESMANCPQTVLEPLLLDAAREAGADIRFETEFVELAQDEDGVTSRVVDRRSGAVTTIRSQYVIGADGARSKVLAQAGLEVEGPADLARAMNIWFRADLSKYFAHRPGVLAWNLMPGPLPPLRLGTVICHEPYTEFVLAFLYDPEQTVPQEMQAAEIAARIDAVVGEHVDAEILGVATWQVNAQVASGYQAGRVFCMGDAVHRHPPTNGLGLNLSIADAYNLAWKLALTLDGRAGPALLGSFSDERQPVGAAGVRRAITSLHECAALEGILGLESGQSEEDGWKALGVLHESGVAGDERRAALRKAIKHFDYMHNAHGLELGYRYASAVLCDDGIEAVSDQDPELHYVPSSRPGSRVPHARIERDGEAISTLDLVDGLGFALLTGCGGEGWVEAAAMASKELGVAVDVHVIGSEDGLMDPYGEWSARREVETTGCVLVRPDRHVAWRARRFEQDSADELLSVVRQAVGWSR
jgi:2,4-dichlorophenol 6-monooxygenase